MKVGGQIGLTLITPLVVHGSHWLHFVLSAQVILRGHTGSYTKKYVCSLNFPV